MFSKCHFFLFLNFDKVLCSLSSLLTPYGAEGDLELPITLPPPDSWGYRLCTALLDLCGARE